MSNPEEHQGENPLMNLIQKTKDFNQVNPDLNQIDQNNPLENAQINNKKNIEPNYEEIVSGLGKLGLEDYQKQKNSFSKKQEQNNFFQNPKMNNNKNNQSDMGAFNYFFGNNMIGADFSKKFGYNQNNNEENNEENEEEKDENNNSNEFNNVNNNFIPQDKIMMQRNANKIPMQMNNNINNNMNNYNNINMDPRIRNMMQQNIMLGNNQNIQNQQMLNNFQRGYNNMNNNNMNNNKKNIKKKSRGNKINNNNNVNIQNMNLIMNQQQFPYNYQYMQNQNNPYIPNQNQNPMNLNNININPNYIPNNRNINRYNHPQQQQVIMPPGDAYPPMNMIGMNVNQNTISLDQFIARANNNFPGKFYVIKSIDESNIISSLRFKIWCSTIKGNQKLQKAYKEADKKYPIFLFFSVNGSGKFMGIAIMNSDVEYKVNFNYWSQNDKWKGFFVVDWICVKDVPNRVFRNIINDLNENKPVTSSRDTQEICTNAGVKMLKIFRDYPQESTIFDSQNEISYPLNKGNYRNNNNVNMNMNFGGNVNNMSNNMINNMKNNMNNNINYTPNKGNMMNMNNMNMGNINLNNINNINMNNNKNIINNRNNMNVNNDLNNNINNHTNSNIPNSIINNSNIINSNIHNPNLSNSNIPNPNIPSINPIPNIINNNNNINYNPMLNLRDIPQNVPEDKERNQNLMKDNNMEILGLRFGNFEAGKGQQYDLNKILAKKEEKEEEEEEGEEGEEEENDK